MLKILPPIWFFLFLIMALVLHFFAPESHVFDMRDSVVFNVVGVVLFIVGMGLSLQSSKLFSEHKTEILPTSPTNRVLITTGTYSFTRNPMYLGMAVSLLGIAFWMGTLPVFLASLAHFVVMNFVFIPFEEKKLTLIFGEQYGAYKNRVRRWL